MFNRPNAIGLLLALTFGIVSGTAQAQFERTDSDVYIYSGERDFEVEIMPGQPPTVSVYAIIDLPVALYVIYSANRFSYEPLGTFQCNQEFSMLKSHSNGLYDVRCVNGNVFNENDESVLKFDGTIYKQIF